MNNGPRGGGRITTTTPPTITTSRGKNYINKRGANNNNNNNNNKTTTTRTTTTRTTTTTTTPPTSVVSNMSSSQALSSQQSQSSSKSSSSVVIRNPYLKNTNNNNKKKSGAGGRKRGAVPTRIMKPGEREAMEALNNEVLPRNLNLFDKFFASLLRTPPKDYYNAAVSASSANNDNNNAQQQQKKVWTTICKRSGLESCIPTKRIETNYNIGSNDNNNNSISLHFNVRACLMFEEARAVLAQELQKKWTSCSYSASKIPGTMTSLSAHYCEQNHNKLKSARIVFHKSSPITRDELYHIRSGTVYEILARDGPRNIGYATLGVVTSAKREHIEKQQCFELVVYNQLQLPSSKLEQRGRDWILTPIASLLSECRCYESLMTILRNCTTTSSDTTTNNNNRRNNNRNNNAHKIPPSRMPFIHNMIGNQIQQQQQQQQYPNKHIRFDNDTSSSSDEENYPINNYQQTNYYNNYNNTTTIGGNYYFQQQPRYNNNNNNNNSKNLYHHRQQHQPPPPFQLPTLNGTQEHAATSFLNSDTNTITLVQGPPGTGKTTLLVSVMCRYYLKAMEERENFTATSSSPTSHFLQDEADAVQQQQQQQQPLQKRLMVSAPTNKAVSVLASRFLAATNLDACDCNIIMVGDADKLLVDERSNNINPGGGGGGGPPHNNNNNIDLRSIFLYKWMPVVCEDYRKIRNSFLPGGGRGWTPEMLYSLANRLEKRLEISLPGLPRSTVELTTKISLTLFKLVKGNTTAAAMHYDIIANIERLLVELDGLPRDVVLRQLLQSADIIFCTLASAGGVVFKNYCNRIDDLIVDEAAAATEPEICIPIQMQPHRVLMVGDPNQLPATVTSRNAIELGLAKSLQERLMFDCRHDHIMLDTQYRMNPEISAFPSSRFYHSKLANGGNVSHPNYAANCPFRLLDGRPYTFLQVAGIEEQGYGGSYYNPAEATIIVDLVAHLQAQSTQHNWCSVERVRVITYYQAQVALLKRHLRQKNLDKVVVATVDSSQGSESDIVIVSFVRSQANNTSSGVLSRKAAGFLTDDRRMNVSLTRARHQLICVGNANQMMQLGHGAETLKLLAEDAAARNLIRTFPVAGQQRQHVDAQLDRFYVTTEKQQRPTNNKKPRYC